MSEPDQVASHYQHGHLLAAILDGVEAIGKTPSTVTVDDLGPVDEFHIGGRKASEEFIDQLENLAERVNDLPMEYRDSFGKINFTMPNELWGRGVRVVPADLDRFDDLEAGTTSRGERFDRYVKLVGSMTALL